MIAAAIRTFGFGGCDNNEADALILWHLAQYALGEPRCSRTVLRTGAIAKVDFSPWAGVIGSA